jgi:hypothetical protein
MTAIEYVFSVHTRILRLIYVTNQLKVVQMPVCSVSANEGGWRVRNMYFIFAMFFLFFPMVVFFYDPIFSVLWLYDNNIFYAGPGHVDSKPK